MVEILIFGTGESAEKLLLNIRRDKVSIIGFIDNDPKKWEKTYYEKSIYPTEKIRTLKFDYIVIASINYEMIVKQLIKIGVSEEKYYHIFHLNMRNMISIELYFIPKEWYMMS